MNCGVNKKHSNLPGVGFGVGSREGAGVTGAGVGSGVGFSVGGSVGDGVTGAGVGKGVGLGVGTMVGIGVMAPVQPHTLIAIGAAWRTAQNSGGNIKLFSPIKSTTSHVSPSIATIGASGLVIIPPKNPQIGQGGLVGAGVGSIVG